MTYLLQDAAGCAETRRYSRWFADRPEAMWLLRKAHNERITTMTTPDIAKDLRAILATLNRANESGVITDTIWHGPAETLWDMVEHTIAAAEAQADELERLRAQVAPAGWKLVPTASTPEMRLAANAWTDAAASVWSAMLAASPAAPAQQAGQAPAVGDDDALDAARWRWWRQNREVSAVVTIFGNGCVNKTIEMVEAYIDADSSVPVQNKESSND